MTTAWQPPHTFEQNTEGRSSSGGWFRIYNVLSELDREGESRRVLVAPSPAAAAEEEEEGDAAEDDVGADDIVVFKTF